MAKQLKQTLMLDMFKSRTLLNVQDKCDKSDVSFHNTTANYSVSCPSTNLLCNVGFESNSENVQANHPSDLSPVNSKGPTMTSFILKNYNFARTVSSNNKERRCFQASWLDNFEWLEYSKSADAAFCFACRIYDINGKKDLTTGKKRVKKAVAWNVKDNVNHTFDGDDIALAIGILDAIRKADFVFMLIFMKKLRWCNYQQTKSFKL
ncbi:hypothetical protein Bhyg_04338, partial [Pseudolycoriella hygida]